MMFTRRICLHLSIILCLAVFGVLSCKEPAPRAQEPPTILLVLKTRDNPFSREIELGVRESLKTSFPDARLIVRAGAEEGDVSGQRVILEEFYSQLVRHADKPNLMGLLLTPAGSGDELTRQIRSYNNANVPVILIDTRIEEAAMAAAGASYNAFIGSDNAIGGRLAADLVLERLPEGGRILILNGVDGHETAAARRSGFKQEIGDRAASPNQSFSIVERTCNWRRDAARSSVDGLLSLGQQFDAVFAANDEMALGAAEAYRQHSRLRPPVALIGFDAIDEAREAVRKGALTATLAQDPRGMGEKAMRSLERIVAGGVVERDQVIPVLLVKE